MDDIKPAPKKVPSDADKPQEVEPTDTSSLSDTDSSDSSSQSSDQSVGEDTDTSDDTTESPAAAEQDSSTQDSSVSPTVVSDAGKPSGHKFFAAAAGVVILACLAGGAYFVLQKNKPAAHSGVAANSTVKKDIPNVRYVTTNEGWDKFYPDIDSSANYEESNREIFEGLVRYENRSQIVPFLATGWTNPDASTWVFNLQHGVKFHTGREMTAEDVKLSFDAAKDTWSGQTFGNTIASVTATGPYQVTIKTSTPDATLLNKLTNYFVYDTKSGKQNDPINGTGAFTIKPGTTGTATSLELVAFDQYHGGRPHVRSITFSGINENDHGKAYGENKADIVSFTGDSPTAVGNRKFNTLNISPLSVHLMILNSTRANSPLSKLKVRQALEAAIDPQKVAKARGVDAITATQIVPKAIPGYNPDVTRLPYDVNNAKKLLSEAGYPNGITLKFTYFKAVQPEVDEITKEAAEAGIKITNDPQSDTTTLGDTVFGGKTDLSIITYTSDILDSSDVLMQYIDTPNYHNQQAIDLVNKAQQTLDASKRLTYLQQANKIAADDVAFLPLFTQTDSNSIIYNPNYVIQRDIENNNLGIYFWKVYAK